MQYRTFLIGETTTLAMAGQHLLSSLVLYRDIHVFETRKFLLHVQRLDVRAAEGGIETNRGIKRLQNDLVRR